MLIKEPASSVRDKLAVFNKINHCLIGKTIKCHFERSNHGIIFAQRFPILTFLHIPVRDSLRPVKWMAMTRYNWISITHIWSILSKQKALLCLLMKSSSSAFLYCGRTCKPSQVDPENRLKRTSEKLVLPLPLQAHSDKNYQQRQLLSR